MKVHRIVELRFRSGSSRALTTELRRLCLQTERWRLLARESRNYAASAGRCSYLVAFSGDDGLPAAIVALTARQGKRLRLESPNIFPQQMGQLTFSEYNSLAERFVSDLTSVPEYARSGIKLRVSSDRIALEQLISSEKTRKLFLNYLHGYPLTFHGSDIANLDRFTCALFRYRAKVSPDNLAQFLIEDRGWTKANAHWVRDRVRTGLEVLAVHRRRWG